MGFTMAYYVVYDTSSPQVVLASRVVLNGSTADQHELRQYCSQAGSLARNLSQAGIQPVLASCCDIHSQGTKPSGIILCWCTPWGSWRWVHSCVDSCAGMPAAQCRVGCNIRQLAVAGVRMTMTNLSGCHSSCLANCKAN